MEVVVDIVQRPLVLLSPPFLTPFVKACSEKPAGSFKKAIAMWEKFSKLEMSVAMLNRQALL